MEQLNYGICECGNWEAEAGKFPKCPDCSRLYLRDVRDVAERLRILFETQRAMQHAEQTADLARAERRTNRARGQ